jgi:hypothetical protein
MTAVVVLIGRGSGALAGLAPLTLLGIAALIGPIRGPLTNGRSATWTPGRAIGPSVSLAIWSLAPELP